MEGRVEGPWQTPVPPVTARARRRGQRRDRVYAAAVELFVEQGYEATTMDDVADRADVSRTSVFNYFEKKSNFLDEWSGRRRMRAFHSAPQPMADTSLREELSGIMLELARLSQTSRRETTAMLGAGVVAMDRLDERPLAGEFAAILERHRDQLRTGVDPNLVAMTLATGYVTVLCAWIGPGDDPSDLGARLMDLLDLLLVGAAPSPE